MNRQIDQADRSTAHKIGPSISDLRYLTRYDRSSCLHSIFSAHAKARPDQIAIRCGAEALTYAMLDRKSTALAHRLAETGVNNGDRVAIAMPRSAEAVLAMLAILKAGAVYVPVDPTYPADHINYLLAETEPRAILVREEIGSLGEFASQSAIINVSADAPEADHAAEPPAIDKPAENLPAYIMFTSGSTGRAKGTVIPHHAISRVVIEQNYVSFAASDVVLHAATTSFDGSTFEIWGALLNGATLAILDEQKFSVSTLVRTIRDHNVTIAFLTTSIFNLFADYAEGEFAGLRHVVFGGEVGSAEHVKRFQRKFPKCRLTNGYGPTETTVFAIAYEVPENFQQDDLPVGKPIAHTQIHILDENLREVLPGSEGQIAIAGDGLALGYLNRPQLTEEKFVLIDAASGKVRCYLTGDYGVQKENGEIAFRGRRDRQVKINGNRVELDEIEAALRRIDDVENAVVECRDSPAGKKIIAYVSTRDRRKDKETASEGIVTHLRKILPDFMIPAQTILLDEFPLNHSGKIDRNLLPVPEELSQTGSGRPVPQATDMEELVRRQWAKVFGQAEIDADTNFFDIGGTSLLLMRVHATLERELGRSINITALFSHPTIRDLADHLGGKSEKASMKTITIGERAARRQAAIARARR